MVLAILENTSKLEKCGFLPVDLRSSQKSGSQRQNFVFKEKRSVYWKCYLKIVSYYIYHLSIGAGEI